MNVFGLYEVGLPVRIELIAPSDKGVALYDEFRSPLVPSPLSNELSVVLALALWKVELAAAAFAAFVDD
jgi:hypothetical protein